MDDFGCSFHQCEQDWPLFDSVPEECRSVQQPSLVTSEDTDLSDDSDKILPSRHKRSRRINSHKWHQTPGKSTPTGWRSIDRDLGEPALQSRTMPTLESLFSPEKEYQLHPCEDVWSGSEEELELEIVNQFLMARNQVMSNEKSSSSPQIFLISGKPVHASRNQVSPAESLRSKQVFSSRSRHPMCQSHVASASVGPSTMLETEDSLSDDLHSDHKPNHLKRVKRELLDTGFERTRVIQESGEDDKGLEELQEDIRIRSQHSKDSQHTAGRTEGHCQSTLGEDSVAQTFVTVSNNSQFSKTREPSNGRESMSETSAAEGKCKTDYSITVPEIYEYFYTDYGEERDQNTLFLHVPSKYADQDSCQRKEINLLTAIKTIVWKYIQTTKKEQSALVPVRMSNILERAKVDAYPGLGSVERALVKYSAVDGSQGMVKNIVQRGRRGLCQFCTKKDLCLFCFACASWAMKSAASQSDIWTAALLVNLSAISAVRYFRRHVQREDSKVLALQDT